MSLRTQSADPVMPLLLLCRLNKEDFLSNSYILWEKNSSYMVLNRGASAKPVQSQDFGAYSCNIWHLLNL